MINPSNHLEQLSASAKRAFLAQLLREKARESESVYPLSYGQRTLWFLHQLAPASPAYNLMYAARLQANLDIPSLREAFIVLMRRHAVLRTTYTTHDGEPVQRIHSDQNLYFEITHAAGWTQDQLDKWLAAEADRPFNLEEGPVFRVNLLTGFCSDSADTSEPILLLTIHHIAVDFWSVEVLLGELIPIYKALRNGQAPVLPPVQWQYLDYVQWERRRLSEAESEAHWQYWRNQLSGELPVLNLLTDRPRPAVNTYRGTSLKFELDEALSLKLRTLAKSCGVTPYVTLLAAFQVLLLRHTGQEDIVIGSPLAGRHLAEFERIAGYFVNPVTLQTNLGGDPTFEECLGRVRQVVLGALEHQEYPFSLLVEKLRIERDLSRSPLFQIAFVWDKQRRAELLTDSASGSGELIVSSLASEQRGAAFDLILTVFDLGGAIGGHWTYNTHLFEATTIARLMERFQTLLHSVVENPRLPVSELALVSNTEYRQLVVEWNQTRQEGAHTRGIHQRVAAWAAKTPQAVAVAAPNGQLTYAELEQRSNQLAHYLRELGVGPERVVAVCLERSLELIVAWLGILKAGGAYLPLDPAYPTERLSYLLEDAKATVVITCHALKARLQGPPARLLCLDQEAERIAQAPSGAPNAPVTPTQLAYIIYTSGSTGAPKGVLVPHQGLLNLVAWHHHAFPLTPASRTTQLAGLAFDAAAWEVWASLSAGATLCLAPPELVASPPRLQAWLLEQEISLTFLPTPLAEAVLKLPWPAGGALRTLLTGGDTLHPLPPTPLPFQVVNNYGPTENSVVSTSGRLAPGEDAQRPPSIGRAIAHVEVYLLDRHLRPVPLGVAGELYLGGAGLARGYHNQPALTAERFIPHPFSHSPGGRLYRTGDVARYRHDGRLEFLGRSDDQLKIRGFRIEPGEIETVLAQHPAVAQAVVVAQGEAEHARLVAYGVAKPGLLPPSPAELRRFLKARLPEYLVPAGLVWLQRLPLTPNGKLDRRQLPRWGEASHLASEAGYVAPASATEHQIARIWQEVLHLEQVGVQDNFFDLGGNSLLLAQANSKLQAAFKQHVPIVDMFHNPTIRSLAQYFLQQNRETSQQQPSDHGPSHQEPSHRAESRTIDQSSAEHRRQIRQLLRSGKAGNP